MISMKMLSFLLLGFLFIKSIRCQSDDVCVSVRRSEDHRPEAVQGRPGKIGPSGPAGAPGIPGGCSCIPNEIEQVRSEMQRLRSESCIGGVIFDGSCFKLHYYRGVGVDYNEAVRLCSLNNGILAEVTSDRVYRILTTYIDNTWVAYTDNPSRSYMNTWLGSTYEFDEMITLSTGYKISTTNWFPGYPQSSPDRVRMMIQWRFDPTSNNKGLFNYRPSYNGAVPLCKYTL